MKAHHIEVLLFIFIFATIFGAGFLLAWERCQEQNAAANPVLWSIDDEG